ncbi:MAG TPA: response regulator, partial [Bacteroidales bacterium]|nr:response regulator [Bacteroidales bacterium]
SAISLHKFRELGIRYHITKPIMPADLNRLVQRLFSKTQPVEDLSDKPDFPSLVRTRRISVLLVEDQLINRKIVVGLLQRKNVDITIAENGEEAVEKTKERRFDLILMDVQMPKMDGLEATRIIRKHEKEQNYHTPIIAMTAHAMKGDKEKGLEAGMDNYITKPVNTKVLFDIIDKYSVQVL